MIFAPGKSVADFQVDSVREAFALQCGVSTAAVTFESEQLHGCPSWDLSQELHVALVQQNVDAFGRFFFARYCEWSQTMRRLVGREA